MRLPDVQIHIFESRILKGNPMGDPHVRKLPIYVPPEYDPKQKEPYPVVFILSGFSGRGTNYLNDEGAFTLPLPERFDQMILSKELPPFIGVFPDASTKFGGSQYINSEATGRYMDYLCDELVPYIDEHFRTHRSESFRGVGGHSSGGFGALVLGMLRPDRFRYICSSAGDSWYEYLYVYYIPLMIRELEKAGGVERFIQRFLESPNPKGLRPSAELETMMNLAMCSCYAPNLKNRPLLGDLYFDLTTGELIDEAWKKFLSWDPLHMVDRYVENLKKLKWIHLEAGTEDEYGLHIGHRQIAKKLKHYGIHYELAEYPGRHGGHHYRFGERIKKMLEKMTT